MSLTFAIHPRLEPRMRVPRLSLTMTQGVVAAALLCNVVTSDAEAQSPSWSSSRGRPSLRQIVSVDATAEALWPYGPEDIAKDGLSVYAADEAAADVRTVYADADSQRVWLRAYVAAETVPTESLVAFFFADIDDRDDTGGPAFGQPLWPTWITDPTPGGYERAIGLRGDGTLLGAWSWDRNMTAWVALSPRADDVRVEVDRDEDPIRIGALVHGYVQVDVAHRLSGLTASCAGNLFVRTWNDEPAPRAFGDDDAEAYACRPPVDVYGDPIVIRSERCDSDRDCPNDGRCRDRVCLWAYTCGADRDCRSNERCTAGACVRVVDGSCSEDADCNGLVCENSACVACSESGARACGDGLACSPNGSCVAADDYVPGVVGDGGVGGPDAGVVRGGAFRCATSATNEQGAFAWLWGLSCAWLLRRRAAKREGRAG